MPRLSSRTKQLNKAEKLAAKEERRRIRVSAWRDEDTRELPLCKGVTIDQSVYQIAENRTWTLLIKGIIVYLITAGGIGSYLTMMEVPFSELIFHAVILITAVLCALLYHSWRSENLGYLIFFSLYAALLFLFRDYINSGFYAIVNETNEWISAYFKTEGSQHYNERIANRYAAVTVAVTLIGIAINILLNNYILRRARYMVAAGLCVTLNLVGLYMDKEPSLLYSLMLIAGLCMTYVLKSGRHFTLSRNDHIFKRRKWGLSYGHDHKSLRQGMILVLLLVLVIANVVNLIRPRDEYIYYREESSLKSTTKDQIQNILILGLAGIWNWYPNNGGLASGELGGVSSIRLDYQPDLNITFTPYDHKTVYVKNLIGQKYIPYENYWVQPENYDQAEEQNLYDAEALRKAYEAGEEKAAKGVMILKNVGAAAQTYHPYYTMMEHGPLWQRKTQEFEYYPLLDESLLVQEHREVDPGYLEVPEDNKAAINDLIFEAGLSKKDSPEETVAKLAAYYEAEIPYTIRPGATPGNDDFVNFFLTENRKGYCAHFASTAVLTFRALGIPARYCEGYAVSYSQVLSRGELVEGTEDDYDKFYSGYSALGRTAVVSVNATDANAHAWVEIYVDGKGWMVAEVTPSSSIDEDDGVGSFWENFNNLFGDGDTDNAAASDDQGGGFRISIDDGVMKVVAFVLLGLIALAALIFLGFKIAPVIRYHVDYRKGDWSERLILYYSRAMRRRRRDSELQAGVNYREQMECLYDRRREAGVPDTALMEYRDPWYVDGRRVNTAPMEELIHVLEQAGFAKEGITEEVFNTSKQRVDELLKKVRRKGAVQDEE